MIYVIDIDGTICTQVTDGRYEGAQPHVDRIEKINKLYDAENTIIYWTARGSNTGKDWTELTRKQLLAWGCKYDELRMKKLPYDVWVDDKAINSEDFFK